LPSILLSKVNAALGHQTIISASGYSSRVC
jgi:hypothetical protein